MKTFRHSRVGAILIFTLLLWGCSNNNSDKTEEKLHLKVDKALMDVSPRAAVIFTSVRLQKDINCLTAQESQKLLHKSLDTSPQGKKVQMMLNEINEEFNKICKFYNEIISGTKPTFEMIKSNSEILKELYSFSIFMTDDDENDFTWRKEEIGLFSSFESCEIFEKRARELDIPTGKCSFWSDGE